MEEIWKESQESSEGSELWIEKMIATPLGFLKISNSIFPFLIFFFFSINLSKY